MIITRYAKGKNSIKSPSAVYLMSCQIVNGYSSMSLSITELLEKSNR